jgi:hypothetical protein
VVRANLDAEASAAVSRLLRETTERIERILDDAAVRLEHDPGGEEDAEVSTIILARYPLPRH